MVAPVPPADWEKVLAKVTGRLVRGQHRVTSRELLIEYLGVPPSELNAKRLRPIMRSLGWYGPKVIKSHGKTINGYWRWPTVGGVFSPELEGDDSDDVSAHLVVNEM